MKPINFNSENYEIVEVNHAIYMFTNMRIDRSTIPDGYHAYDVRESDGGAGDFASIEPFVFVNHWGTIIGKHELPMVSFGSGDNERKYYYCDPDDDGWFTGDYVTSIDEYEKLCSEHDDNKEACDGNIEEKGNS